MMMFTCLIYSDGGTPKPSLAGAITTRHISTTLTTGKLGLSLYRQVGRILYSMAPVWEWRGSCGYNPNALNQSARQ